MEQMIEKADNCPYCVWSCALRKVKTLTEAGSFSGESSRMKGTKKLPHIPMKVKIVTTMTPGHISGSTMRHSTCMELAPSILAASSSTRGTPSMKFFISQIPNGSAEAA